MKLVELGFDLGLLLLIVRLVFEFFWDLVFVFVNVIVMRS